MPIITCGGMRMQQTWKPGEGFSMEDVSAECQANFEAIVDRAMALGINHFETARGYGCSEVRACVRAGGGRSVGRWGLGWGGGGHRFI